MYLLKAVFTIQFIINVVRYCPCLFDFKCWFWLTERVLVTFLEIIVQLDQQNHPFCSNTKPQQVLWKLILKSRIHNNALLYFSLNYCLKNPSNPALFPDLHIEGLIGIYLSLGTINPRDFIRYRLIYGCCLGPIYEIEHRL